MNKLIFLGTGTSSGVPVLGCACETCRSSDPKDKRFRTSAYIITHQGTKILIDVGPDFRQQGLQHKIHWLDGILITHSHHDHIGGLDELRQLNFVMQRNVAVYGNALALAEIRTRFDYIFKDTQHGGGKPRLDLHLIEPHQEFVINTQKILPIEIFHGRIPILGYKMDGLVYITDASDIPADIIPQIRDADLLVINALRFRPHPTHFSIEQTLAMVAQLQPRRAYLVHTTHDIKHATVAPLLPEGVFLAWDNLEISF